MEIATCEVGDVASDPSAETGSSGAYLDVLHVSGTWGTRRRSRGAPDPRKEGIRSPASDWPTWMTSHPKTFHEVEW